MAETQQNGNFGKAFVPGLVIGLVVGAFAGAVLPNFMNAGPEISPNQAAARTGNATPTPRDERPPADVELPPAEVPPAVPGAAPESPQTPPATAPATGEPKVEEPQTQTQPPAAVPSTPPPAADPK